MAAYTSTQSGNWSSTATWGGSGVPGNGDTATIASGHAVTVDVDSTVGTSPAAGTTVLSLASSTATLTLASGVTFTVRGDTVVTGTSTLTTQITLNSGATWKFDASQASTPSTTKYRLSLAAGSSQSVLLLCRGTPSAPVTFTSETANSAAYGYITGAFSPGGSIDAEWTNFVRLGDSAQDAIFWNAGHATNQLRLVNCTFDTCGRIDYASAVNPAAYLELRATRWTGTTNATCLNHEGNSAITTGTRLIDGCSFDKSVNFFSPIGLTIRDTYFADGWVMTSGNPASISWCFIRDPDQGAVGTQGTLTDCYWYENHTNTNPHAVSLLPDRNVDITRLIFEWTGTGTGAGDMIVCSSNPANARVGSASGCLLLPGGTGSNNAGKLVALLGGTNVTMSADNNTVYTTGTGETSVVCYGETYAGRAGMVTSCRSNIAWNSVGSTGYKVNQIGNTTTPTDVVTVADYNCGHNLASGSEGKGYNKSTMTAAMFTASTPGVNDIDVNPVFRDPTRNVARWGASRGADGTAAGALAIISNNPYVIRELIAWVRAGFEPLNKRLHNAGHAAQTIGAVEYTPINRRTQRRAS